MNIEKLINYIDKKIEYELARKEPGPDGYYDSCIQERKEMEKAKKELITTYSSRLETPVRTK